MPKIAWFHWNGKFLEKYYLSKHTYEEIKVLNSSLFIKETESVI